MRFKINIFCLYGICILTLIIPNISLYFTEKMGILPATANIVLPAGLYMIIFSLSEKIGRTVWLTFILFFFAAFQLVLLYLFGSGVIAVDMFLNLVTTNPGEAFELLDNLIPAVAGVFILYLPVLITGGVAWKKNWTLKPRDNCSFIIKTRHRAAELTAAGVILTGMSYMFVPSYSVLTDLYPVNVFYNLWLAIERTWQTEHYNKTSAAFTFNAVSEHPADSAEVYIMVIGETARAHNFSLYGYKRDTNPYLETVSGTVAFSNALTQSNTTHKSVPMLLSAVSAEDYNDIYSQKGIITAFKEAGFHTVFISNQRPNHSFIDIFGKEAHEYTFIKEKAGSNTDSISDTDILPLIDDILEGKRKKELIILHTYGSHFNYIERYPRSMAYYTPDSPTEAKPKNKQALMNAYDNTIRFTDYLLHLIITRLERHGALSALLYASDHGENIFDDARNLFLHASPSPSEYELSVPFIIWMSPEYIDSYPSVYTNAKANSHKHVATSASVFHTMLHISGISSPLRRDSLAVTSRSYTPKPYRYLSDHNTPIILKGR
ncbi:phosphoethanolamine transferase [Xylanibacter muris]|uniref:phosphoethanolamine transferase n=1 Tax=Xylanibacter muris TaxID=2736290 RepID=UPI0020A6294B|nr:phosphoethanolamine transferase [Xylanibacter muris]